MSDITTEYNVKFINYYYDEPLEITFKSNSPDSVDLLISALSAFYSGDEYECFINGEQAVLENDWGLIK